MGTTPNFGWTYPAPTNYVKDLPSDLGDLADEIDATVYGLGSGLKLIKTQAIGTNVTTVAVTNAFSADYKNYKIMIIGGSSASSVALELKLGTSTASYKRNLAYQSYGVSSWSFLTTTSGSTWTHIGSANTATMTMNADILAPYLTQPTQFSTIYLDSSLSGVSAGYHDVSASYTDFSIICSQNISGGTIYVYGYED